MMRLEDILSLVVAKVKEISAIEDRMYYIYPPVNAAYPCISYYDVAINYDVRDDESVPLEFVLSFDLFSIEPVYSLEKSLDEALDELTIKKRKESSVPINDPFLPDIYRRNVQYRFIWNY